MVLFQHWELQSTKKEDLQLLFSRELRHPEVVGKKELFFKFIIWHLTAVHGCLNWVKAKLAGLLSRQEERMQHPNWQKRMKPSG